MSSGTPLSQGAGLGPRSAGLTRFSPGQSKTCLAPLLCGVAEALRDQPTSRPRASPAVHPGTPFNISPPQGPPLVSSGTHLMGLLAPEPDKMLLCSWDGTGLASRKGTLPVQASRVFPCKLGGPAPAPSSCLPPPPPPPQPCHRGLVAADSCTWGRGGLLWEGKLLPADACCHLIGQDPVSWLFLEGRREGVLGRPAPRRAGARPGC